MLLFLGSALITDPGQYPGYSDLQACAQAAISGCYGCYTGVLWILQCSSWTCACDDYGAALSVVESVASSSCTGDPAQVTSATNIWNGFCSQLSETAITGPTAPTATANPTAAKTTLAMIATSTNVKGGGSSSGGLSPGIDTGIAIASLFVAILTLWVGWKTYTRMTRG